MGEPLVIGNALYAVTGFPNKLIAYDLSTGKKLWTYAPPVDNYAKGQNCCGGINRGAAYADGKIIFNLLDNTVVAVNADPKSRNYGREVWRRNLADPHTGVTMTVAPIIVPGNGDGVMKVITASSSGEMGVRGWIQALKLSDGTPLWRAYNTGSDTEVKTGNSFYEQSKYYFNKSQLGSSGSWDGEAWKLGGSAAWAYLTYDTETNQLFYGTSQPGVWNADMRPGDNKWGSSIFARDADTGMAKWAYQTTPHDSWDYDAASENIAVNQDFDSQHKKLLIHFNKNGFAYVFDRYSGEVLSADKFEPKTNWADSIDLQTGLPNVSENMRVHQGVKTENICPSVLGAKGWEPGAYSPDTHLFYMPTFNLCGSMKGLKAQFIAGAPYMGTDYNIDFKTPLDKKEPLSKLIAWDALAGRQSWKIDEKAMIYGGVLTTKDPGPDADGLVFYTTQATLDKTTPPMLKAVNASTGVPLWNSEMKSNTKLNCNTEGNPISFLGPDGKQRIAVYSDGCGEGGWVHVYKLP